MIANPKLAVAAVVLGMALAACSGVGNHGAFDVRPIGDGLQFLGLSGVLGALIIVLGRFLGR